MTTIADLSDTDRAKITVARDNGIEIPLSSYLAALDAGVPYAVACAVLMTETSGGRNLWGHDDTWMIGYPRMDEATYMVYKAHRAKFGNQGVGPCQLTHPSWQDKADALGGCWIPRFNCQASFEGLRLLRDTSDDWHEAFWRYNGLNKPASFYADPVNKRRLEWRKLLGEKESV